MGPWTNLSGLGSSKPEAVEEERQSFEGAKRSAKFKPIGFKLRRKEEKSKKRRVKGEKNGEKKRRKVEKDFQKT